MKLPEIRKGVIGIYSIQEKAEMTLVNLVTWPEGFRFIDHFRITCYTGVVDRRTLHLGITSVATPV